MDEKERNRIMGVVTFFIGLILLIVVLPILTGFSIISFIFMGSQDCLILDIFVLVIALFLYTYLMIRPIKTLKGKKILAIVAMIFGGVLVVFPLVGIGILFSGSLEWISYGPKFINTMVVVVLPFVLLLMPGIILFIHGWQLRKRY